MQVVRVVDSGRSIPLPKGTFVIVVRESEDLRDMLLQVRELLAANTWADRGEERPKTA